MHLTGELIEKLSGLIQQGGPPVVAAESLGVRADTFGRWMERGARRNGPMFRKLFLEVKRAEAVAHLEIAKVFYLNAQEDPRHAKDWLQLRHSLQWAKAEQLALTGAGGGPVDVNVSRDRIMEKLDGLRPTLQ